LISQLRRNNTSGTRERTEVIDVKHLCAPLDFLPFNRLSSHIGSENRRTLSILAHSDMHDRTQMSPVEFDELDPVCLLLPELEDSILRTRQDEIRSRSKQVGQSEACGRKAWTTAYFVTAICERWSRCMKDFQYRSAEGSLSR
jgi:hypothetical protein